jgi:hypothetical protein
MSRSYICLTSITPSFNFSTTETKLTTTFTTLFISDDWTNDGSGKFTYIGNPRIFYIYVRALQDSSTVEFACELYLYRNDSTQIALKPPLNIFFTSDTNSSGENGTSSPIIINTNDFFYVYIKQGLSTSGISNDLQIDISIISPDYHNLRKGDVIKQHEIY